MESSKHEHHIDPLAVSTMEAARLLGISRPKVYALMQNDGLPWFKVGSRTLIPVAELKAWVAAQLDQQQGAS